MNRRLAAIGISLIAAFCTAGACESETVAPSEPAQVEIDFDFDTKTKTVTAPPTAFPTYRPATPTKRTTQPAPKPRTTR